MSSRTINCDLERSAVGLGLRKIAQWIDASDFTDGGGTTGTLTMTEQLPAGSFYIGCKATVKSAFDDDTTCVLTVGKTSGEDEFSDGTSISLAAVADVGQEGEAPLEFLASDTSVYLVATSASDFTDVAEGDGKMLLELFYLSTEVELVDNYPDKYNSN